MSAAYRPPAGWSVRPFDAADRDARWLVEAPGGRRWQVNEATVRLLEALDAAPTLEEAAQRAAELWKRAVPPSALRDYLDRVLVPQGLVSGADGATAPDPRASGGRLAYLSFRRTLVPPALLERVTGMLRHLYQPAAFWACSLAALCAALWYLAWQAGRLASLPAAMLQPGAVLLALASTFVHELGHAAACRRFGARHGAMGWGIYLVFPVLYMEVDETWRLPRSQRAVVDAAGLYLQLLFGLAVAAGGLAWKPLADAAPGTMLLIGVALLTNLNPLFRFDGYWLLSDALGVPNLRRKSGEMLRSLLRGPAARGAASGIPQRTAWVLAVYAVGSNVFFAVFFARLLAQLPGYAMHVYPALAAAELSTLRDAALALRPGRALRAVLTLAPPTAMLVGVPLIVLTQLRALARRLRRGAPPAPAAPAPLTPTVPR
ncbi:MAG: ATPase involved in chromosome partitioning [Gemmatimonadetes bacterium]|nr:ATPase involved in chromosome partitioning [Gemmatimonadota bacterium]